MTATILIVDDEPDIRELIGEILADEDYRPVLAADASEARRLRAETHPDLILLDVWMPDTDGISLLKEWARDTQPDCPVVMISGHGSVEAAVEATRIGASDFIEKPVSMARLLTTIRKALAGQREQPGARALHPSGSVPDPIGRSEAIETLRARLARLIASPCNMLISGEPGSGRTTLAWWVHEHAPDSGELIEVSLSGDTLAPLVERRDPDPDAPPTVVLDRFESIDTADCDRLDGLLARWRGSARFVAITTPGLDRAVAAGRFDEALYHRIAETVLEVPALRERREDVPDLVRHFAERLPAIEQLPYRSFPVPVQNLLRQHDWPGNLNELANLVRELLLADTDAPVTTDEVARLLERPRASDPAVLETIHSPLFTLPLREAREAFERQYLVARLREVDGSVGQLAETVGMERTHLYRKLRQLGIDPKQVQETGE